MTGMHEAYRQSINVGSSSNLFLTVWERKLVSIRTLRQLVRTNLAGRKGQRILEDCNILAHGFMDLEIKGSIHFSHNLAPFVGLFNTFFSLSLVLLQSSIVLADNPFDLGSMRM
jgi:hypothetical protein